MGRKAAVIQVAMIGGIVAYGTVNLFTGNFEQTFATLPLLFLYYVFITARQKRRSHEEEKDDE